MKLWLAQVDLNHRPQSYQDCALPLSYGPMKSGNPGRSRTYNLCVRSAALYPLSYGIMEKFLVDPVGVEPTTFWLKASYSAS